MGEERGQGACVSGPARRIRGRDRSLHARAAPTPSKRNTPSSTRPRGKERMTIAEEAAEGRVMKPHEKLDDDWKFVLIESAASPRLTSQWKRGTEGEG